MKDFRNELLEDLLKHSGEFVDIKYLTDKYCGTDDTFEQGDLTKSRCRLSINMVLRELKDMNWINLNPPNGMSTAHSFNHSINKRQFLMDTNVLVRMTTHGEIEYKKSKQAAQPQIYNDNSIHVGNNLTGIANTGSNNQQSINENTKPEKPKWMRFSFYWEESIKSAYKWVLGVVVVAVLTYLGCNLYTDNKQSAKIKSKDTIQAPVKRAP